MARNGVRLKVAVVGTGISGLSAAWLLSPHHDVTVYEQSERIGGHSNTVIASVGGREIPVDTGFIVFNRSAYPNLTALFERLAVPTQTSDMSLAVSLDNGNLEYSGTGLSGLFAQPRNLFRPRFWSMLRDLVKFYRQATRDVDLLRDETISLGDYLTAGGYGAAFRDDHLLPMASAIWSAPPSEILSFPVATFIRFHSQSRFAAAYATPRLGNCSRRQHCLCKTTHSVLRGPDQAGHRRRRGAAHRRRRRCNGHARRIKPLRPCRHGDARRSGPLGDRRSHSGRGRTARRFPLQPQSCCASLRSEFHAQAPCSLVELELYWFAR